MTQMRARNATIGISATVTVAADKEEEEDAAEKEDDDSEYEVIEDVVHCHARPLRRRVTR
jgi:hypothetical protein